LNGIICVVELVAPAVIVGSRMGRRIQVHDRVASLAIVNGPLRQTRAVRIAIFREVRPIGGHQVRQRLVFRSPWQFLRSQRAEHELDLRRVVRAARSILSASRLGTRWRGRSIVELITVERRFARGALHLQPFPGGEGDELVARQILRGSLGLLVCVCRVEFQELVGLVAEMLVRVGYEIRRGRGVFPEDAPITSFIVVPSGQERHVTLFAAGKNFTYGIRQEMAVDIRREPDLFLLDSRVEEFGGGLGAQVGEGMRADGLRKFRVGLLSGRQRLQVENGAEEGAALADRAVKQALGQGRCHQRTDRKRSGRFAEDGHVGWVAAETGNVFVHPFEGRHLVEQTIIAGGIMARLFG